RRATATLFPYTTLFRSTGREPGAIAAFAGQLAGDTGQCIGLAAELAGEDGPARLAGQIAEREPALHILVNNAGANAAGSLAEMRSEEHTSELQSRENLV